MIEFKNVTYEYQDGVKALDNININLAAFKGEHIFGVLGESGSGKTTFLNCLARFVRPGQGNIFYGGEDIQKIPEREFRKKIGIVFQGLFLFPHMTVIENMTLALIKTTDTHKDTAEEKASEMLERLGIRELAESYPSQISGGQAQRAAIGRGLMLDPEYMLLDEPTSALDANTTGEFGKWLTELRFQTKFIIVTHDTIFAEEYAPVGIYLSAGKILDAGKIKDIVEHVKAGKMTYC
ncbi:MAG: ATP-binding cassette domain-containing protein [Candidatus Saccharimonadaceae bacterium]|nr:ATP-binding cassette domain-containing protein [Candidatus Saccharimonadaceae bacterium]